MKKFLHHPDNFIIINNEFQCTLEQWMQLEPTYSGLPEGFIGREYNQGIEDRVYTSSNEKILGSEWMEGDFYISKIDDYKTQLQSILEENAG
jgi:hypothetical protein